MMLISKQLSDRNCLLVASKIPRIMTCFMSSLEEEEARGEFRVLQLFPNKLPPKQKPKPRVAMLPARETLMPVDQDWPSVWPGPRSFHPDAVPLPIRQGWHKRNPIPPSKRANTELIKIPNFLHLTPPAIRRQCEAIKQFCTKWPKGLETNEKCEEHFPMEIITSDYCFSSPTIREPLARVVSLRVKLSSLKLDSHGRDKIRRLLGNRYQEETDLITIDVDRCPMKKQNIEYSQYLLTAVYNEARKIEAWEAEKTDADMEYYDWDVSNSRKSLVTLHAWPEPPTDDDYTKIPHSEEFKVAVSELCNNGEDEFSVNKYKDSVKQLLKLKN